MKKPLLHHLHDYFFPHPRNNYRPHLFSVASIAVLAIAVIIFEAGYLVQTKFVFLKTDFLASVLPGTLVALANQDRAMIGVLGVTEDSLLSSAAQAAADDMAARGYFSHISPDGKTPWYWLDQAGYRYSYAGQNLAVNFTDSENVETAWMASPTHRANIEKPQYTKVGIGVANGIYEDKETTFVVEFFAAPASPAAQTKVVVVEPPPGEQLATSTQVLGSQTAVVDAAEVAVAAATAPVGPGWFTRLLASPLNTLVAILTVLLGAIAVSFTVSIFIRGKVQHPTVIIGGVFLLLLISGAILLSVVLSGPVIINN
ncbi:MAG: CAP domain-containing protein [Candidatus Paceibacterota bacterium]|jgi:hypothetical protein